MTATRDVRPLAQAGRFAPESELFYTAFRGGDSIYKALGGIFPLTYKLFYTNQIDLIFRKISGLGYYTEKIRIITGWAASLEIIWLGISV